MYRIDCTFFDGYKPCKYQKDDKSLKCDNSCPYYTKKKRVLMLKKGAIGEVLRCTVLFEHLTDYEITILTDYPEIINKEHARCVLKCKSENFLVVGAQQYDLLLSLDKDIEMCALACTINAKIKKGFYLDVNGKVMPFDEDTDYLWKRGIDDEFMKKDPKNYSQLIIEASGFRYKGREHYVMPKFEKKRLIVTENADRTNNVGQNIDNNQNNNAKKKVVGLNTGAGAMWITRIWPKHRWLALINQLMKSGYDVIILGGPSEHEKNLELSKTTGAYYFGVKDYIEFINIVDNCDIVVTAVTFALHIAIGLDKKVVLFNNIFNKNEFKYDDVSVIEPKVPCTMCYKSRFDSKCAVPDCMDIILPESVFTKIKEVS